MADLYVKEPGWTVRGISRDPSKAQSWTTKGVEVVKADLNDKESLVVAFKGANAIFSNTDFWNQFYDPATRAKLKPGQSINEYCYDIELQQGKNIGDAAATVEGLDRFVISSVCNVTKLSKGKYTWVYHFDAKARAVEHIREEHPELAAKMSIVQIGCYMNNWKRSTKPAKVRGRSLCIANFPESDTPRSKQTAPTVSPTSAPAKHHFPTSIPRETPATLSELPFSRRLGRIS